MAGLELRPSNLAAEDGGFCAKFEILIDTWAGRTTIELRDGDERRSLTLEIGPHASKLGANEYDAMLGELSERSPGLVWGLSPGAEKGNTTSSALAVVHPAVVSSQLPLFEKLVARFLADPPVVTQRIREAFPLDLSRRVDLKTIRWLSRRPTVLRAVAGDKDVGVFADPRTPVDQPSAIPSFAHPVTRYFVYLLFRLRMRFSDSAYKLKTASGRPFRDEAVEAHANEMASSLQSAGRRIDSLLTKPLFRELVPEPIGDTVIQSLADHPLYSAIHRVGRRMLEPGLAYSPGGDLQSALKHTYDLFELFVLYRLIEELPGFLGAGWSAGKGKALPYVGREERPANRSAWWFNGPNELSLELRYQQWFSRARLPPDMRMFSCLSGALIPDYILVLRKQGKLLGWLILDAKYRSGRQAVEQGLADVHRYRDALRIRGERAKGAFIIVPRLQEDGAPYADEAYLKHHSFGLLKLYSPAWLAPVYNCLKTAI